MNRTTWTTAKAFLSNQIPTDRCRKECGQKDDTIHILIDNNTIPFHVIML